MVRWSILLAGIFLILPVAAAGGAETLVCDYKEQFKSGGSREVRLELATGGGEVTGISYHNAIASGKEGGGYLCAFDASAAGGNSTWTRKGHRVIVELKDGKNSTFEIRKSKKGFMLLFLEMSLEYCGFGAEFPEYVLIDRGKKKCRVKF
jgi:hypothetical protein